MKDLDKLEASIDAIKKDISDFNPTGLMVGRETLDQLISIAEAHLAAQRQGGDAGVMPDIIYAVEDYGGTYNGFWHKDAPGSKYIRADLAHPPAVTGDRVALDALAWVNDQIYRAKNYRDFIFKPKNDEEMTGALALLKTIRAALIGGVPGEVVEKVAVALKYYAENSRSWITGNEGSHAEEALTLLQPYLNNGRGGEDA